VGSLSSPDFAHRSHRSEFAARIPQFLFHLALDRASFTSRSHVSFYVLHFQIMVFSRVYTFEMPFVWRAKTSNSCQIFLDAVAYYQFCFYTHFLWGAKYSECVVLLICPPNISTPIITRWQMSRRSLLSKSRFLYVVPTTYHLFCVQHTLNHRTYYLWQIKIVWAFNTFRNWRIRKLPV